MPYEFGIHGRFVNQLEFVWVRIGIPMSIRFIQVLKKNLNWIDKR